MMSTLKVTLFTLLLVTFAYCKMQTVMVKGQVACSDKSVNNVHVELREADTCQIFSNIYFSFSSNILFYTFKS